MPVLGTFFSGGQVFASKAGLPERSTLYLSQTLGLFEKKNLPGTNTLAYFVSNSKKRKKKSFITLTPGVHDIKLLTDLIYECK